MLPFLLVACTDTPLAPADPCAAPGAICTWLGLPEIARTSADGEPRTHTATNLPLDVAFAVDGTAFYPDFNFHRVRRIDGDGLVWTVAGTLFLGGDDAACWSGCDALTSPVGLPTDAVPDPADPDTLWLVSADRAGIDRVDLAGSTVSWWAGTGDPGHADGPREAARFVGPTSLAVASDGTLYVSDPADHVIRRIALDGVVDTLAGQPGVPGDAGDGGPAADALLGDDPFRSRLALDGDDRLILADTGNGVIRAIDLVTGTIERIAGTSGVSGYGGDGGPALDAVFAAPSDVAVGPGGEIYVADDENACVRVIRPDGIVEPFAGICTAPGFAGDGGPAHQALLGGFLGVAVGPDGAVYVADTEHHVIRRIAP